MKTVHQLLFAGIRVWVSGIYGCGSSIMTDQNLKMKREVRVNHLRIVSLLVLFLLASLGKSAGFPGEKWSRRVLITNDDGIDDVKIIELARAFAKVAETYVLAPLSDQSGSSNHSSFGAKKSFLEVEKRDLGSGIVAYGVDGYPADCLMFGFLGLLKDNPPDLLVSGINGGPNLGIEWSGSGTIGAARTAALGGMPAIAVSGLDEGIPGAVTAACRWVVNLAQSSLVKNLKGGQYLTVSIPRVPADQIRGVAVVPRGRVTISAMPTLRPDPANRSSTKKERWIMVPPEIDPESVGDVKAYIEKFIAIVPMNVNEVDYRLLSELWNEPERIPLWRIPPTGSESNLQKQGT